MPAELADLERELRRFRRVIVAFSGGADSAFLAWVANSTLGRDRVLCVTAISASLAQEEESDARALAKEWNLRWKGVPTYELENPRYVANQTDRCAYCKSSLMDALIPISKEEDATVVLGVNVNDLGDYRPGQKVAEQAGAEFPLVAAGFEKQDIRDWSRRLDLRTWDKPAAACLASRLPYGTEVTIGRLSAVAKAESGLRRLGFSELRVRHHGDIARVEVGVDEIQRVIELRDEVLSIVHDAGYLFVTLDLDGFRSGSLNHGIDRPGAVRGAGTVLQGGGSPVV